MNEDELMLRRVARERNVAKETLRIYLSSARKYSEFHNMSMQELINEADNEEEKGIRAKRRKIKTRLLDFRTFLIDEDYSFNTIQKYIRSVRTIYNHFEIEVPKIPPLNRKDTKTYAPTMYKDLLTKDIIKEALKISNPLMRAIILFMSSSGCAKRETLNLTLQDFIDATYEYHHKKELNDVLDALISRNDIIPTFTLRRQKVDKYYYTFCSPEAVEAIISYLLTRENFDDEHLFSINEITFSAKFTKINYDLGLPDVGSHGQFVSHMLRKFHSNQLKIGENALNESEIHSLQGRGKDPITETYFFDNPNELKKRYIAALDNVTINLDVNNLDIKSPAYVLLESEVKEKNEIISEYQENQKRIEERLLALEQGRVRDFDVDEF